jgi:opacity protein-like surface antigen
MFCYDSLCRRKRSHRRLCTYRTDGQNLNGLNAKYGYTPDESDLGVITSLTISANDDNDIDRGYGSALVGASYKVNDVIKPYVMVGIGRGAIKANGETDTSTGLPMVLVFSLPHCSFHC